MARVTRSGGAGRVDWSTGVYNPDVEITRDTTTLYASDRDVFLFLVDGHNPIEAGRQVSRGFSHNWNLNFNILSGDETCKPA